jgi:predicted transposase YdaD
MELIMRLAPLYQQDRELAKQEGRAEGRVEGRAEGIVEGRLKGGRRFILRILNRRFGEIDASLAEKVNLLSMEQLEALAEALLDFSALTDLEAWLYHEVQSAAFK